ncbi:hypothetical protein CGRA01v4_10913 [Colletotrichum graminicola]|nr:hypothetical protein CGRA01v4_10913 [Colletotrichum graminicola]
MRSQLLTVCVLATSFASGIPIEPRWGARATVGYRTVHPEQARIYNSNGKLSYDPTHTVVAQIGLGVYTTPGPGQWPGEPGDWYCHITAQKSTLDSLNKVWVPRRFWNNLHRIDDWIDELGFNPALTLRLSPIEDREDILQLLIPPTLLSGHKMDFKVHCAADYHSLPYEPVNYSQWKKVYGNP